MNTHTHSCTNNSRALVMMACLTVKQFLWPFRDSTDDDRYVLNLNEGSSIGIRTLVQQVYTFQVRVYSLWMFSGR